MYIEEMSTMEILTFINQEDKKVADAIEKELSMICKAVELGTDKFKNGGRIIYVGAGSSGRIGVMDAIEMQPTYNIPNNRYFGIIAGGKEAMFSAVEDVEDNKELAVSNLQEIGLSKEDVLFVIAASGKTPFCLGALEYGNQVEALTISLACVKNSDMGKIAQVGIEIETGKEVVEGSTRMKAGTGQKMVLNMFSSGIMINLHKVYQNMMIHVRPTNKKLVKRAIDIMKKIIQVPEEECQRYLDESDNHVPTAIVMQQKNVSKVEAEKLLEQVENNLSLLMN